MEYRILALDIDGTLTNSKKEITDRVKTDINKLYKKDIPVLLVSGRPTEGIYPIAEEIGLLEQKGYILAFNGGKIIDTVTKEVMYQKSIPNELVNELCDYAEKTDFAFLTYKDGKIITTKVDDQYVEIEARINKLEAVKIDNMRECAPESPDKFLLVGDPDKAEIIVKDMAKHFEGRLNIFRSEPFFIEIVPLGIDKAESLAVLLEKIGLKKEEMVACGDGRNDVTMIKYAGMGVAMENACEEVKEVSNYVTLSNDEDGVAVAIEKFFII